MKRLTSISVSILGSLVLFAACNVWAKINTVDNVPAATLLLPYFEVDPASATGIRTVFTVGNVSPVERLAHVTLWTDRGVPTITFDVRLPARGVQEIDLGALFTSGTLPASTAGGFATCNASLPPANLNAGQLQGLRNAHAGLASSLLSNQCGGATHGDSHDRGYITVDAVSACSTSIPGDPGYFVTGGTGIATNNNVLWGEQSTANPSQNVAWGDALVHIEADAMDPATDGIPDPMTMAPDYTFYGRILNGSGADNREALSAQWNGGFSLRDPFTNTTAIVWRDPGALVSAFSCGSPPAGLGVNEVLIFDLQEHPTISTMGASRGFPLATQTVSFNDASQIAVPYLDGMMRYTLSLATASAPFGDKNQAYVSHHYSSVFGSAGLATMTPLIPITEGVNGSGFQLPQCSDGIDNDGDGLIDFPADPGCRAPQQFTEATECSDGIDNDGDGLIDFPADPDCYSANDLIETNFPPSGNPQCDDGIDNDLDGLIDYPADPRCFSPFQNTEAEGICGDGIDNDADGLVDFPADPGCQSRSFGTENPACTDGLDNDMDGLTDFPADPGCKTAFSLTEAPVCLNGIDDDMDGLTDFPNDPGCVDAFSNNEAPVCNDGVDNDGDGLIDFPADPGCASASSTTESPQCNNGNDDDGNGLIDFPADPGCSSASDPTEITQQCNDGIDNDGNGLIDFPNDPGCSSAIDTYEAADCGDSEDNDHDGSVDLADPGCASVADLNELANTTTRECRDGIDNDGDGLVDFPADTGCTSAWDDVEYTSTGSIPTIVLTPTSLPSGTFNVPYSQTLTATGGLAPYTFTFISGNLPPGLNLAMNGSLSGTPTSTGTFNFTAQATDGANFTGTRAYSLLILSGALAVVTPVSALSTLGLLLLLTLLGLASWVALRRARA